MGMMLGKISVETPKWEVLQSYPEYEIRVYPPCVVAQVTYDNSSDRDGGFMILANYIGALGNPQNHRPEKIAMTAPVITTRPEEAAAAAGEKIAMTAPVVTNTAGDGGTTTMQFVLPSSYRKTEDAPRPVDERVVIREVGESKYAVVRFSGVATDKVVEEKVRLLEEWVERDGHKRRMLPFLLGRYNPPWTIPAFRTNEVMLPLF